MISLAQSFIHLFYWPALQQCLVDPVFPRTTCGSLHHCWDSFRSSSRKAFFLQVVRGVLFLVGGWWSVRACVWGVGLLCCTSVLFVLELLEMAQNGQQPAAAALPAVVDPVQQQQQPPNAPQQQANQPNLQQQQANVLQQPNAQQQQLQAHQPPQQMAAQNVILSRVELA